MNFALSMAALLLIVGALAFGLLQLGLTIQWVGMISTALVGAGVLRAVGRSEIGRPEHERIT